MTTSKSMLGKSVLITGAASGLGRATALALAEAGARLFMVGRDENNLAETANLVGNSMASTHIADLTDRDTLMGIVESAVQLFGQLDALCNVAGIIYVANSHDMPLKQWDAIMATNLTAPFLLSQAAIPHLLKTNGAIVNVASAAAFKGQAYGAAYSASKAGVVAMTKSMAMEYANQPIRINAVAPGGMITNAGQNFHPPEGCDYELLKRFTGPRGGMVDVSDVAAMIVHLASSEGRGFHGACINLDAGITAG